MQSQFDVVLHAAAVSDYTVDRIVLDGQVFALTLAKTFLCIFRNADF